MEAPGSIPHPGSSEGGHQQARRNEVFDYILTSLPLERRQAFDEALRADRGLVERESDPLRYLRFESGRVSAAGDRLASYWEERKKIFQERFLLPMTVTGQGALDERSLQVISAGVMLFLPDDVKGRSVLYLDHEVDISHNLTGMEVRLFRGRVRFYLLHRAVERGRPLVCLRYTRSSDLDKAKVMAFQRYLRFFPVTLESLVLVYHVPAAASRVFNDTGTAWASTDSLARIGVFLLTTCERLIVRSSILSYPSHESIPQGTSGESVNRARLGLDQQRAR
jgi:hypothetical protein